MKITWLGHSAFRIEIGGQILLIDPWLHGNPVFPDERHGEAVQGATHILVTHGHADHASEVPALAAELGIPVLGIFDLMGFWQKEHGIDVVGFNKGGTVSLNGVTVTMVNAVHSSSVAGETGPRYTGAEAGYMISGEGHTIYVSGDTDIMADMQWMGELHAPDIGILCAGGHFTMDMARAAWAAKRYFDFRTVIPCHYRTFGALEQSAERLVDGLPDVDVRTPEVMETVEI
ncbi:metal-dependent hydrolase [Roseitranquillus sediminis]|uniref:metal-dependent hydrolase n=1 Tax=Roseitranquillus sediminis TaxID=2809051 RepID=UPI001D0C66AF|nr:metal-dependent hydrolase [Roseitranquillus sediminis]MBM9595313.1 metal-dependent hydrolase [Roseitranquillus sediminis]